MYYPFSWLRSAIRLLAYLLVFALVGLYLDDMLFAITLGALGLLIINYWQLFKLNRWLWHSRKCLRPRSAGCGSISTKVFIISSGETAIKGKNSGSW